MPGTEAGMIRNTLAPSICDMVFCNCANSTLVGRPIVARSAKGLVARNTAPAFDAAVLVAPSKPAKATVWATPGFAPARSITLRTTASVRSSDEPGGNCTTVMK